MNKGTKMNYYSLRSVITGPLTVEVKKSMLYLYRTGGSIKIGVDIRILGRTPLLYSNETRGLYYLQSLKKIKKQHVVYPYNCP